MPKPNLVLVHGLLGALDCLSHLESLIATAQAGTIHLIGYGRHRDLPTDGITLAAQAVHAAAQIEALGFKRAAVLGHSVGGAVSMFLADQRPDLIETVINVEGNFTLKDAFWSSRIAAMSPAQWAVEFQVMRNDPRAWLDRNKITCTAQALAWATTMLQREQPAETIHDMARAVVAETSPPTYLQMILRVLGRTPVHLIAGQNSATGWDVPDWALAKAASFVEIPQTGHMMMLEDPVAFARAIDAIVGTQAPSAN